MNTRIVPTALVAAALLAGPTMAQGAPANPTEPIYSCASIAEDVARLACFDEAVADFRTKEEAGLVQTVDVAQIEAIEKEAFGFSMPSLPSIFTRSASRSDPSEPKPAREEVSEITVAVKSARIQSVTSRAIVTLENGQTWEQIDTTKVQASSLRHAKEARVRKAALGSFMMSVDGGRSFRVKRIS